MRRRALGTGLLAVALAAPSTSLPAAPEARVLDRIEVRRLPADPRFDLPERWTAPGRPQVALALSGGGGYGAAHLGVLYELLADGVEIDGVAGTSIGALIGAFLCAGYAPQEIEQVLRGKNWDALVTGLDVRRRVLSRNEELVRSGQVSIALREGERLQVGALAESSLLERELYRYLLRAQLESGGDFDRLRYRYRPVATDVRTGTAYVPAGGDLVTLVRGSSAVPGLFRPVPEGDALLVDGGLVQNIPVEAAETLGADVVLAVDVSQGVVRTRDVGGALDVLNRSVNIMMSRRSTELLERADLAIAPDVSGFGQASLAADVDDLVRAGREAYRPRRAELWERLEAAAEDRAPVAFDRIEIEGTDWIDPALLASRLGGAPGTVTRYRVAAELARSLNRGPLARGHVEWLETGDGRALRFVFEPQPTIAAVQVSIDLALRRREPGPPHPVGSRFSAPAARRLIWRERDALLDRGHALARVRRQEFDPATRTLIVELETVPVDRVEIEVDGDARLARAGRLLRDIAGPRFTFDRLADRLDELVARGAILGWTLVPAREPDGGVRLDVRARAASHVEASASGAFRGPHGFAGFLRGARTNVTGRGDMADLVLSGGRDRLWLQGRYRAEFGFGFRNFGLELGARLFDDAFLFVDREQEPVEELDEDHRGQRFWIALLRRLSWGAVVQGGFRRETDRLDATETEPAVRLRRTSAFASLELDRQDRLLFPERGGRLRLRSQTALGGDDLRLTEIEGDLVFALDRDRRHVMTARFGAGVSSDAGRRPFWFDPGGFRDLYGFLPYGAAAPQYARAGLVWRHRLLDYNLARIYVEAGIDGVTTALRRADLGDDGGTAGFGASVTAFSKFIGPITVGVSGNGAGAETVFVTAGFPLPD